MLDGITFLGKAIPSEMRPLLHQPRALKSVRLHRAFAPARALRCSRSFFSFSTFAPYPKRPLVHSSFLFPQRILSRRVATEDLAKPTILKPATEKHQSLEPPFTSLINPPPSTRPPPLDTPTRDPSSPVYKYYYILGKAYLTFYKTALKAIYANYQTSRKLHARLRSSHPQGKQTLEEAVISGSLSRAEYQLLLRTRSDLARLPIFGLIFCLCGEFTPLVVLLFSNAIPRTAWIPKQVDASRTKLKARLARAVIKSPYESLHPRKLFQPRTRKDLFRLKLAARHLGLYRELWDRYFSAWGGPPVALIRRRYERRKAQVEADDVALKRDGGGDVLAPGQLEVEELKMASEMRGLGVVDHKPSSMRKQLRFYLNPYKKAQKIESSERAVKEGGD